MPFDVRGLNFSDTLKSEKLDISRKCLTKLVITDILKSIKKSDSIIDLGCGVGFLVKQLRKKGYSIWGIDSCPRGDALRSSIRQYVFEGDITTYEFGQKYDVAILCRVLEHLPDYLSYLNNIDSVITDSGLLLIVVPNDWPFDFTVCPNCNQVFSAMGHLWRFTKASLEGELKHIFHSVSVKTVYNGSFWSKFIISRTRYFLPPPVLERLDSLSLRFSEVEGRWLLASCSGYIGMRKELLPKALHFSQDETYKRIRKFISVNSQSEIGVFKNGHGQS